MRSDNTLTIRIDTQSHRDNVSFDEFTKVCSATQKSLREVERCVLERSGQLEFKLSNLLMGSAIIEVTAHAPKRIGRSAGQEVVRVYRETMASLERGYRIDPRLDLNAFRAFEPLGHLIIKRHLQLSYDGVRLTNSFVDSVAERTQAKLRSLGSVKGRLEVINLHGSPYFYLYATATDRIRCSFDDTLLPSVIESIGKKVSVYGEMGYVNDKPFPITVDVTSFTPLREDNELSSLLKLRGCIKPENRPQFLAEMKALRNGWN